MEKMQVIFERCKGCGLCTTVCPKQIVALQKEKRKGLFYCNLHRSERMHQLCNVRYDMPGLCNIS